MPLRRDYTRKKTEAGYFVVKGVSSEVVRTWASGCEGLGALMVPLEDGKSYPARQTKDIRTRKGAMCPEGFKNKGSCACFLGKPCGSGRATGSPVLRPLVKGRAGLRQPTDLQAILWPGGYAWLPTPLTAIWTRPCDCDRER